MEENSKKIELAKKLKALAEKGVGGEKMNAEKMLNDFLKKHNIRLDEIESEQLNEYYFNVKDEDIHLWVQIARSVNRNIKIYGKFTKKTD